MIWGLLETILQVPTIIFSILSNGLVFLLNQNKTKQNRKLKQKKERERKKTSPDLPQPTWPAQSAAQPPGPAHLFLLSSSPRPEAARWRALATPWPLPRASIAISILGFRTFIGIMSSLLAFVTGDVAQIPLGWCWWVGAVLSVASSIPTLWLCELPPPWVCWNCPPGFGANRGFCWAPELYFPCPYFLLRLSICCWFPSIMRALSTNSW